MPISEDAIVLAQYLAGEFDNQVQALADPAWYVHLRLWMRPVPLFQDDSLTLYAEQASVVNLNQPYRPRLLRITHDPQTLNSLVVQYYQIHNAEQVQGGGLKPELLSFLDPEKIEFLPGCTLTVTRCQDQENLPIFTTQPQSDSPCCFTVADKTYQVALGFEASSQHFLSYDQGINPQTGQKIWGALLGPYRFTKRQDFASELRVN